MDKWATVLRYGLTYVLAPLAARKGLDAAQTGSLIDATLALCLALATAGPLIWNLVTRPSTPAMQVAIEADKVLSGEKPGGSVVVTPPGKPDIAIAPSRGGQG